MVGYLKRVNLSANESEDSGAIAKALISFQDNIFDFLTPIFRNVLLDGIYYRDVQIQTSETKIPHRLQRSYIGYIICGQDADARIWTPNKDDSDVYLNLQASASVNADIWVF